MKHDHSTEEYISEVQQQIRWKRARKIATHELADHIEDRKEALMGKGLDENAALSAAIADMGDPRKIGSELDMVYRPKVNLLLIELTAAFLILGAGISYLSEGIISVSQIISVLIGIFSAVVLYFSDYTVMLRHPLMIYFIHMFITAALLVYEARNGFEMIGYSYTFYFLMLFPVSLTVVAADLKNQHRKFGLFVFTCYAIPLFLTAFLLSSLPGMTMILITYMMLACFGIRKHWFSLSYIGVAVWIGLILAVVFGMWYISNFFHLSFFFTNTGDEFVQRMISDAVFSADMWGSSKFRIINNKEEFLRENYPFVILLNKYGYFAVGCIIALFVGLLAVMIHTARKQKTEIGKITAWSTFFVMAFQLLCSVICHFANFGSMSMCIPFLLSGGAFNVIDLILIGMVLSVSRHEDMIREWIRYKDRKASVSTNESDPINQWFYQLVHSKE